VPQFKDLKKPKQHFILHLGLDTLRCGPPRGYWCFSFEGFHQRVKRIASGSNFQDVQKRIMTTWAIQFGKSLVRRSKWTFCAPCEES